MTADEMQIRRLIERWAEAVHAADMDGVLADHTEDIVMFDVPPPNEVRGKPAYRDTWPPFFEWQKKGPHSRLCRSTLPRGVMSLLPMRCSAAVLWKNSRGIRTAVCD